MSVPKFCSNEQILDISQNKTNMQQLACHMIKEAHIHVFATEMVIDDKVITAALHLNNEKADVLRMLLMF